jgi:hypothetical protein
MKDLRVCDEATPAAWIAPRLGGEFGAVARTVPRGYAAYVRICHPVANRDGSPASWSGVAATTGRRAHPLMQWHALVRSPDPLNMAGSLWRGTDPSRGNLEHAALGALCELLADHTTTPADCFFCLWDGYGWVEQVWTPPSFWAAARDRAQERGPAFSAQELSQPRVELPGRSYLLLAGALPAALAIVWVPFRQSPNLFWPADHAWCAATELDFDATLIAGTSELVEAILASPALDAWPVGPDDSLAADADRLNAVP